MTPRQSDTLACIRQLTLHAGHPPTVREVAREMGVAPSTCHHHIDRLVEHGYLERKPGMNRTLKVTSAHAPG